MFTIYLYLLMYHEVGQEGLGCIAMLAELLPSHTQNTIK